MNDKPEITVIRASSSTRNLLSAFGSGVKETRLTSFLGYLLSLDIHTLNECFGITESVLSIEIEKRLITQRCDIVINTINKCIIIEAKKNNNDTLRQLDKQAEEHGENKQISKISLTRNKHDYGQRALSITWNDIYSALEKAKYGNQKQRVLSEEFMTHLEDVGMVKAHSKNVYARDVNRATNLALFLQARVYFCKANDNIYKCSYFAPYFGNQISVISPGIKEGMSYIAKIEDLVEVNTHEELVKMVKKHLKENKVKCSSIDELLNDVGNDEKYNDNESHILLLLGKPRMLFNPPIPKNMLQEGNGWLSKNYYEFDELFESANL